MVFLEDPLSMDMLSRKSFISEVKFISVPTFELARGGILIVRIAEKICYTIHKNIKGNVKVIVEAGAGIEPAHEGFAVHRITTLLPGLNLSGK